MRLKIAHYFLLLIIIVLWPLLSGTEAADQFSAIKQSPIPAQFEDKSLFLSPIKQTREVPSGELVTGLTVPHHLLASNLIAKGFNFASRGKYSQILLISPDHYSLGDSGISAAGKNFSTVFGELSADLKSVKKLEKLPFVHEQNFFYREHGIQAELPFIKYYFPDAKIIALAVKETAEKSQLDQLVDELKKILAPNSLVIQSTDFSHYLTPNQAEARDQQTIEVLKRANPEELFYLEQPANLDCIAAQYVQIRLQNELYGSKLHILDHKNSQDYTKEKVASSTSYIVQVYTK